MIYTTNAIESPNAKLRIYERANAPVLLDRIGGRTENLVRVLIVEDISKAANVLARRLLQSTSPAGDVWRSLLQSRRRAAAPGLQLRE
jgi:hypothetical protein